VVGAGIGGLGAARPLRQRGFAAEVVEREPAWTHTGAGIYLPGNATRALRALGLESAVAERASLISHQRLCDHRGRLLADIELAALWCDVGPCLALHRADLHEVLASHGDPLPVRMGVSLQGLSQQDGTVPSSSTTAALGATTWSSAPTVSTPRSADSPSASARSARWDSSPGASSPSARRR